MATRFYFSPTVIPPAGVQPAFAAWTRTTEGVRLVMKTTKPGDAMASLTTFGSTGPAANDSSLFVQFVSDPLPSGIAFATTDTIKCFIRAMESATNDNINRQPICLKVVSYDGGTIRATLKALGHYGPNTTEWVSGTLTSKTWADGDTLDANYTTVDGDRLVLEIGGQVSSSGGVSVVGTISIGSNSGTDIAENETVTAANNPWFEISRTFTMRVNSMPVWQVPWRRWLVNQRRMP